MSVRRAKSILALGMLSSILLGSSAAVAAGIRKYRYQISSYSLEPTFAYELPGDAAVDGQMYSVETDDKGRIASISLLRGGRTISEDRLSYPDGGKLPEEVESTVGGEKTGITRIRRDKSGRRIREDYFTMANALTSYLTYASDPPKQVTMTDYGPDGKKRSIRVCRYSAAGAFVGQTKYSNPADRTQHIDGEIDETTGHIRSARTYRGALVNTITMTYGANGDKVRADASGPDGKVYTSIEYQDDLMTARRYWDTREVRFTYDEKRNRMTSTTSFKGETKFTLYYERSADGTIKRTLAKGPDGTLWGEYPDAELLEVAQDGRDLNGRPGTLHHSGNWW